MDQEKISDWLRRTRYTPSTSETERFVGRVMAALPAGKMESLAPRRWFAPALGVSFAVLVVSLLPIYRSMEEQSAALLFEDQAPDEPAVDFAEAP
jgi:hypothetical protein